MMRPQFWRIVFMRVGYTFKDLDSGMVEEEVEDVVEDGKSVLLASNSDKKKPETKKKVVRKKRVTKKDNIQKPKV